MARSVGKLNTLAVKAAEKPGLYGDGAGLYLHVGPTGGKSLSQARQRAADQRRLKLDGIDPLDSRQGVRDAAKLAAASAITFKACAVKYITANRAAWRNAKHGAQWTSTLTAYAYPIIGDLPVGGIDTGHVTRILEPIWTTKSETASRLRGRIEAIMDYARTHRWRDGENPARWKGHLENVLPKLSKVRKVEHHAALPWREISGFLTMLRRQQGIAPLALQFAILAAARTGEVIGAQWNEIDFATATWSVPADRMKADREHRVPLSAAAVAVLRVLEKQRVDDAPFVFPGGKAGKALSNMAMLALLKRLDRPDLTTHGFRSTFRDWAAETGQPADIAEAALAHMVGDKTVAAYQRGDLLDRRRALVSDWAGYCALVKAKAA